jgi:hypothetical protein
MERQSARSYFHVTSSKKTPDGVSERLVPRTRFPSYISNPFGSSRSLGPARRGRVAISSHAKVAKASEMRTCCRRLQCIIRSDFVG